MLATVHCTHGIATAPRRFFLLASRLCWRGRRRTGAADLGTAGPGCTSRTVNSIIFGACKCGKRAVPKVPRAELAHPERAGSMKRIVLDTECIETRDAAIHPQTLPPEL